MKFCSVIFLGFALLNNLCAMEKWQDPDDDIVPISIVSVRISISCSVKLSVVILEGFTTGFMGCFSPFFIFQLFLF